MAATPSPTPDSNGPAFTAGRPAAGSMSLGDAVIPSRAEISPLARASSSRPELESFDDAYGALLRDPIGRRESGADTTVSVLTRGIDLEHDVVYQILRVQVESAGERKVFVLPDLGQLYAADMAGCERPGESYADPRPPERFRHEVRILTASYRDEELGEYVHRGTPQLSDAALREALDHLVFSMERGYSDNPQLPYSILAEQALRVVEDAFQEWAVSRGADDSITDALRAFNFPEVLSTRVKLDPDLGDYVCTMRVRLGPVDLSDMNGEGEVASVSFHVRTTPGSRMLKVTQSTLAA